MRILGLSGSTHDPAACLVVNGNLVAAVEEERLTRIKHAPSTLPVSAAEQVMEIAGLGPNSIDLVAYFLDPEGFNRSLPGFVLSNWNRYLLHPKAYHTKRFLHRGKRYKQQAEDVVARLSIGAPITYIRHHAAHASAAFYGSGYDEAMILTADNIGEVESTQLAVGRGRQVSPIATQKAPHSLGMLYAAITGYLGFRPWDEEGKVMALAAYGTPIIEPEDVVKLSPPEFRLSRDFQLVETENYNRCYSKRLVDRFGPARTPDEPVEQRHKDIAASVQNAVEYAVVRLVSWLHDAVGIRQLCLAGGVAFNCRMNGVLLNLPFINSMYVFPAAGDSGAAAGAAMQLAVLHGDTPAPVRFAGLGKHYSEAEIETSVRDSGFKYCYIANPVSVATEVLLRDKIICWFQGRAEFGPRALGHRSILALPHVTGIRDYIKQYVDHRELWRPLCPSINADGDSRYFDKCHDSRFMNVAHWSRDGLNETLPEVFHVDGSARIQVVHEEESSLYEQLLLEIESATGYPILLNTSFNSAGIPIVETPKDALDVFRHLPVPALVMGHFYVEKEATA